MYLPSEKQKKKKMIKTGGSHHNRIILRQRDIIKKLIFIIIIFKNDVFIHQKTITESEDTIYKSLIENKSYTYQLFGRIMYD